jgi:hypothetical protein
MPEQKPSYIGQYGYDPTKDMQDMDTLEMTNKYGMSYEKVEDPDDTGRNIFSIGTQGFRGGNVEQGGGEQEQASLGESIIGGGTGGTVDTRQQGSSPSFMKYGSGGSGGGGANYEQIAKTGASTLASAMSWLQGSKAQDVEDFQKQLDTFLQNQYDQDQLRQQKFTNEVGDQKLAIGQKAQAEEKSWDQELLRSNELNDIASKLRQQAVV